jgi:hypothetical protein
VTRYPIPDAALDDRLGWLGTSGSGKTYNAGGGIERLLQAGARVVIVDPLGVWWGLRLLADGKAASPFNVAIFGGPHGDLPLNEHSGALIGETSATMAESCIIDLSEFASKAADRRFMVAFLETLYRKAGGEPFHLIVDEADLFAPQKPGKGDEVLLGHMENIVRRGRVKGFIPWLISQRPAVLNKNVLSQVDGLIAFMLTASHDRNALDAWIEGQADPGQGKQIKDALPTLPIGTGVVWLPRRQILETAAFPAKLTFDSSRTPKRGEKRERRDLKPVDLGKLKEKMAAVVEEAKANDPKVLKAEIADLRKRLLAAAEKGPEPKRPAWPDQREEVAELRADLAQARDGLRHWQETAETRKVLIERARAALQANGDEFEPAPPPPPRRPATAPAPVQRQPAPVRERAQSDGEVPPGCAKPLAALAAVYPSGLTEPQWATSAGYKRSGGTWGTYKSRLRGAGLIEAREGRWFATEAGAAAVGDVEMPPAPGPDLVRWWAAKLPGTTRIAEALIEAWPHELARDDLAERVGMAASGGSFGTYLSRLAGPGLIERGAGIRLSEEVMAA